MMISWSLLALSLIGAEGQQPSPPIIPRSPTSIGITVKRPSLGMASTGACALLEEVCANLCPEDILDDLTVAACSGVSEPGRGSQPGAPCRREELLFSTLPMSMPRVAKPGSHDPEVDELWPMTLRDAIRIALDNSEVVRVISFGGCGLPIGGQVVKGETSRSGPIVIARVNADASFWRLQAEVMAQVRSVEQAYWNLATAHVQLWAADRALSTAKEVYDREQAEHVGGRGTVADVAEAAQRLEQFNLDLVTRTSDVITTERQLRNLLGLPPADNRRIIPVTPPAEARLEPDWDSSLAEMLAHQPDIVQQRCIVRLAELQLLVARNQPLPPLSLDALDQFQNLGQALEPAWAVIHRAMLPALDKTMTDCQRTTVVDQTPATNHDLTMDSFTFQTPVGMRYPLANARQAQYILLRSRAYYQQVVHQTTHALARFFLEIDANYKQLQTATRMTAAAQRLDAQRAYYEEGRITIDRFLDAVSQYTTAEATEAQYKATYNISIVALEEAKGTLLAYDDIVVAEGPRHRRTSPARPPGSDLASRGEIKVDHRVETASATIEEPKRYGVPPAVAERSDGAPKIATLSKTTTWTFSLSVGNSDVLQFKGSVTSTGEAPANIGH